MPISRRCGESRVTSMPPRRTSPGSGAVKPAKAMSSVVFPDPEGPRRVKNSPASTSRSMPCRTCCEPSVFDTPRIDIGRLCPSRGAAVLACQPGTADATLFHQRIGVSNFGPRPAVASHAPRLLLDELLEALGHRRLMLEPPGGIDQCLP